MPAEIVGQLTSVEPRTTMSRIAFGLAGFFDEKYCITLFGARCRVGWRHCNPDSVYGNRNAAFRQVKQVFASEPKNRSLAPRWSRALTTSLCITGEYPKSFGEPYHTWRDDAYKCMIYAKWIQHPCTAVFLRLPEQLAEHSKFNFMHIEQ